MLRYIAYLVHIFKSVYSLIEYFIVYFIFGRPVSISYQLSNLNSIFMINLFLTNRHPIPVIPSIIHYLEEVNGEIEHHIVYRDGNLHVIKNHLKSQKNVFLDTNALANPLVVKFGIKMRKRVLTTIRIRANQKKSYLILIHQKIQTLVIKY